MAAALASWFSSPCRSSGCPFQNSRSCASIWTVLLSSFANFPGPVGSGIDSECVAIGMTMMNMISRTSMTSMSGVMFISDMGRKLGADWRE